MRTRLNVFQRLARQWDEIHPYNAAQILKIQGAPDVAVLREAWHDALESLGLGRVRFERGAFSYECLNGEMSLYGVRVVPGGIGLEEFVSGQLNRRFDNPLEPPFRPFILAEEGFFYAGVVYHHWVADSVSIRDVLREWFVRVFDPAGAGRSQVRLPEAGYGRFLGMADDALGFGRGLLSAARWASGLRRARRVAWGKKGDLAVRLTVRWLEPGLIERLRAAARARGVRLNDLFLAAIAQVCDAFIPLKHRPQRDRIALGAIVDLRPYCEPAVSDAFGLFLGFTNVLCRPRELCDREDLVRSVAAQTSHQKSDSIAQSSAVRILAGVAAGRLMRRERMVRFYQRHVPLAGGISNVNLSDSWAMRYHPEPVLDYIRVSPTGPMMPLVFATTTLGQSFHFALTYRPSVVAADRIDAMAGMFVECLSRFLPDR